MSPYINSIESSINQNIKHQITNKSQIRNFNDPNIDGRVKSPKAVRIVIPAQAVVRQAHHPEHSRRGVQRTQQILDPRLRGDDVGNDFLLSHQISGF